MCSWVITLPSEAWPRPLWSHEHGTWLQTSWSDVYVELCRTLVRSICYEANASCFLFLTFFTCCLRVPRHSRWSNATFLETAAIVNVSTSYSKMGRMCHRGSIMAALIITERHGFVGATLWRVQKWMLPHATTKASLWSGEGDSSGT